MRKFMLALSVAAFSIAAPAVAQGEGKSSDKGKGAVAAKMQQDERKAAKARGNQGSETRIARAEERRDHAIEKQAERIERRQRSDRDIRIERADRDHDRVVVFDSNDQGFGRLAGERVAPRHFGCPPGLWKRNNGCLPPGLARKLYRAGDTADTVFVSTSYAVPVQYRTFYLDGPDYIYRYDDLGYIYRIDRNTNIVAGLIPLLGGGFAIGQPLPIGYDIYNVPLQYRDVYYDTDDYLYRYGDNAIYRVDPDDMLIRSVVALLAGDLGVGQPLPLGYDIYNVPLAYRGRYYDTDDAWYRYSDGYIYEVDPETRLIQAVVEALT